MVVQIGYKVGPENHSYPADLLQGALVKGEENGNHLQTYGAVTTND